MSDEITRYDMSIEWGSMCGCEVVYVSDGEYVRYADYAALRAQLTTAERERDEARRALRVIADANVSYEAGTADYLDMAHQTVATVRRLRHRAERAERVVEAAKAYLAEWDSDGFEYVAHVALIDAVRALDAAEGKA